MTPSRRLWAAAAAGTALAVALAWALWPGPADLTPQVTYERPLPERTVVPDGSTRDFTLSGPTSSFAEVIEYRASCRVRALRRR